MYRQTDRKTDRQTDTQTHRQTHRQTERQKDRKTDRQTLIIFLPHLSKRTKTAFPTENTRGYAKILTDPRDYPLSSHYGLHNQK